MSILYNGTLDKTRTTIPKEARLIEAIRLAGPRNVALLSKMTGIDSSTVRYSIHKRFRRFGLRMHANIAIRRLGLVLHWADLDFSQSHAETAPQVLNALNQVGYLSYFAKVLPSGRYVALFALPSGMAETAQSFLDRLATHGILKRFNLMEVRITKYHSMKPRYFNFKSGRWEIDWSALEAPRETALEETPDVQQSEFDYFDLLIIKELQKNPLQTRGELARKIKISEQSLRHHYEEHVMKEKLITGYSVRWTQDIARALIHSVINARITVRNLSDNELSATRAAISRIPFLWEEDVLTDNTYVATLSIPLVDYMSTLRYLQEHIPEIGSTTALDAIEFRDSTAFTIPYHLFQDGHWLSKIGAQLTRPAKSLVPAISDASKHNFAYSFSEALGRAKRARTNQEKKQTLEYLTGKMFEPISGLSILGRGKRLSAEEIDLLVENESEEQFWSRFGSPFLIECKYWSEPVGSKEIRDLFGKLESLGLGSGILVSPKGITGDQYHDAKLIIREYRQKGKYLVVIDGNDLSQIARGMDPAEKVKEKYHQIFFL